MGLEREGGREGERERDFKWKGSDGLVERVKG